MGDHHDDYYDDFYAMLQMMINADEGVKYCFPSLKIVLISLVGLNFPDIYIYGIVYSVVCAVCCNSCAFRPTLIT